MQALRTTMALGLGLSLTALSLSMLAPTPAPIAQALALAVEQASEHPARLAEVAVAFDRHGRPMAHAVRRSTGSSSSDATAVDVALELASLRAPAEVAGKTVTFTARFE